MSVTSCAAIGDPDALFLALLPVLRTDAVAGTRDYRRREIHRGRAMCGATLCGDCEQDVLMSVYEVVRRYATARAQGKVTRLTVVIDTVLERAAGTRVEVNIGLLRTILSNAAKDIRLRFVTGAGRAAKPESTLRTRADFQPLRDQPVLLEVALLLLRFSASNSALTASIFPHAKMADQLSERLRALDLPAPEGGIEIGRLIVRVLDVMVAIDDAWTATNFFGPLSERLNELPLPDCFDVEDGSTSWDDMFQFWEDN